MGLGTRFTWINIMSFTCLKCAKCMAGYEIVITHINEETKTITTERVKKGKCCENCLSIEKRINKGQHYVALNLWREKKQLHKKLTIRMVDDVIDALQEIVPKEFDDDKIHTKILEEHHRGLQSARAIKILIVDDKERAVLSLRKKTEEAGS